MANNRCAFVVLTGLGLTMALVSGCQTWTSDMTMPSPHYIDHPPQYFAPSPPYPLNNELSQQQRTWTAPQPNAANSGTPAAPVAP